MIHLTVIPGAWSRNVRSISPNRHSALALEGRPIAGWVLLTAVNRA